MKAWTLTAFYLSKDIWSRWLETPGAVLARLLVAVLLGGLMLVVQTFFTLAGRSLEARVARLGARTLLVTEAVVGDNVRNAPLSALFAPLADRADLVALRQLSTPARDELGRDCTVMAYDAAALPALAPMLAGDGAKDAPCHLLAPGLPSGVAINVEVDGRDYRAVTVARPAWFEAFAFNRPVVLLPAEGEAAGLEQGYIELAMLVARDADAGGVARLAEAVRALLFLENRSTAQVQSPEALLGELERVQTLGRQWQAAAGLLGGVAVALVFGSIAILEYRQNRFIVALLRSFGAPATLLLLRYAVEALLLAAAAVLAARGILVVAHGQLFALAGFEPALLDRALLDPYGWPDIWRQARWLALGAGLGVLPVALAMRAAVGRVLQ
jgi:hypothetical protein